VEREVSGNRPESDPRTPVAELAGSDRARLGEMFAVDVERKSWRFETRDGGIELAIDRGEIRAGARREAFCEVELELIRGEASALFALARGSAPSRRCASVC